MHSAAREAEPPSTRKCAQARATLARSVSISGSRIRKEKEKEKKPAFACRNARNGANGSSNSSRYSRTGENFHTTRQFSTEWKGIYLRNGGGDKAK